MHCSTRHTQAPGARCKRSGLPPRPLCPNMWPHACERQAITSKSHVPRQQPPMSYRALFLLPNATCHHHSSSSTSEESLLSSPRLCLRLARAAARAPVRVLTAVVGERRATDEDRSERRSEAGRSVKFPCAMVASTAWWVLPCSAGGVDGACGGNGAGGGDGGAGGVEAIGST